MAAVIICSDFGAPKLKSDTVPTVSPSITKVVHQRIDAFQLWCCRRLLRISWTARRSNQSILKEISPEYSLEGLMLKLKLQYFGHLMGRTDSWKRPWCWESLKVGEEGDNRGWNVLDHIIDSIDVNLSKLREFVMNQEAWHSAVHGLAKSWHNWVTEMNSTDPRSLPWAITYGSSLRPI